MSPQSFFEAEVFALAVFSLVLPMSLYGYMMWRRALSRATVLLFGAALIGMAGVDVALLQRLSMRAKTSLLHDAFFSSELSMAVYVLPVVLAGVGVNMISHILIRHLTESEKQFERDQR